METRASYVLVGAFVLGLVAAAVWFVIWKADFGDDGETYHVALAGAANGVSTGTIVRYRGIKVGTVVKVEPRQTTPRDLEVFDEKDKDGKPLPNPLAGKTEVIDAEIKIKKARKDEPYYNDMVATVESQGLTGAPFIQLTRRFAPSAAPLAAKSVIRGDSSGFEALLQQLPTTLRNADEALKAATRLADNAAAILDKDMQDKVRSVVAEVEKSLKKANELLDKYDKEVVKTLDRVRDVTLRKVDTVLDEAARLMVQATGILRDNRRPIADFAATGLYEFSLFLTDTRKFVRTFDRIMTRIESDPSQFLFGNRQRGFETQGR
jgi:phospholipid/cholesterol/gamma-HCH transport system substrate-binding protein